MKKNMDLAGTEEDMEALKAASEEGKLLTARAYAPGFKR